MASKKKNRATNSSNLPAVRIGSRMRCTDDGVEGRIVWANAVAVKIQWDDGEQVTWKRDSLATRPIELLDNEGDQSAAPARSATCKKRPPRPYHRVVRRLTATALNVPSSFAFLVRYANLLRQASP
jgi:hypothetical protein